MQDSSDAVNGRSNAAVSSNAEAEASQFSQRQKRSSKESTLKDRYEMQREYQRVLSREPSATKRSVVEPQLEDTATQRLTSKGQSPLRGIKTYEEDRAERMPAINRAQSPARQE